MFCKFIHVAILLFFFSFLLFFLIYFSSILKLLTTHHRESDVRAKVWAAHTIEGGFREDPFVCFSALYANSNPKALSELGELLGDVW